VNVFFNFCSAPDKANSNHSLGSLYQSGLGMPDRDYYLDADKAGKRDQYLVYIQRLFSLIGNSGIQADIFGDEEKTAQIARDILAFETSLAKLHLSRTESRDPNLTYNKMSVATLSKKCQSAVNLTWSAYLAKGVSAPMFDWVAYFALIGKPVESLGEINVSAVQALTQFHMLLDDPALKLYLLFHVLNSFAPHLSQTFVQAHFQFHEKELKGTAEIQPRWKRALQSLESALGEALGKLYVAKHFPSDAKSRALKVVESVRDALRERLHEVEWMSESSRQEALKKMEKFKVKIGYPDMWKVFCLLKMLMIRY
jgi:putative endopeptidase